jgi:transposase-like protein
MRKKYQKYDEEFKLSVLRDYYDSGMSMYSCAKKHGIDDGVLLNWRKRYECAKEVVPLQLESSNDDDMANRSKDDYRKEIAELKKRNRELEKALKFSRLETLARDVMIDKAEEYFDIAIRKKSGAKQP